MSDHLNGLGRRIAKELRRRKEEQRTGPRSLAELDRLAGWPAGRSWRLSRAGSVRGAWIGVLARILDLDPVELIALDQREALVRDREGR